MDTQDSWFTLCSLVNSTVERFVGDPIDDPKIWQINDTVMRAAYPYLPFVGDDGTIIVAFDVRRYGMTTLEVVPIFKGDLN